MEYVNIVMQRNTELDKTLHFTNTLLSVQVLLAFANGLNQLYFYYETKAEKGKCKGIRCVEQNNAFSTCVCINLACICGVDV